MSQPSQQITIPRKHTKEADVQIQLAAGDKLQAESFILRTFSSCARVLPSDADVWDVSGFLYDGEPFSYAAVKCWLDCAYSSVYGAAELDAADINLLQSATALRQVLMFAQAVGSPEGVLKAACSHLAALQITVQLPEQTVELQLSTGGFFFYSDEPLTLACWSLQSHKTLCSVESQQQREELQKLVARPTGDLLHIAHMLRLQPLLDVLHDFIYWATPGDHGLLYGVLSLVFTDAVLQAAVGTGTVSKEAYINSVLAKPCSLAPDYKASHQLFKRTGDIEHLPDQSAYGSLRFEAQLLQDFKGAKAGDSVTVRFDLFSTADEGGMYITSHTGDVKYEVWLPVQLWVGSSVNSARELDAVMHEFCNLQV